MISRFSLNSIFTRLLSDVIGVSYEGHCYGLSSLSTLYFREGEEGRKKFWQICELLHALDQLFNEVKYINVIDLINDICSGKFKSESKAFATIKKIDPNKTLLKNLPMLTVIQYLFTSPEEYPEFTNIVGKAPLADQDFIRTYEYLSTIGKQDDLILKLSQCFPKYKTLDEQSFVDDFKRVRFSTKNDVTHELTKVTLNKEGLLAFCKLIKSHVKNADTELATKKIQGIFSIASHAVGFQYDEQVEKWFITDNLNIDNDNILLGKKDCIEDLFTYLTYDQSVVTFSTEILADVQLDLNKLNIADLGPYILSDTVVSGKAEAQLFTCATLTLHRESNPIEANQILQRALSSTTEADRLIPDFNAFSILVMNFRQQRTALFDYALSPKTNGHIFTNFNDLYSTMENYPEYSSGMQEYAWKNSVTLKLTDEDINKISELNHEHLVGYTSKVEVQKADKDKFFENNVQALFSANSNNQNNQPTANDHFIESITYGKN